MQHLIGMISTKLNNRLYITVGIVLAGLLLVLVGYPLFSTPAKKQTVIKYYLPSEDLANPFSGFMVIDKAVKEKKVIRVSLSGDNMEDDKKMNFIQQEARRLKYTCDTSDMIEIYLPDNITYGRFVELVNIMLKDGHKRYALWKHHFYIFGEAPLAPETTNSTRLTYL